MPEECLSETAQLRLLPTDTAEKYPRRPSELHDLKDASGGMKPAKKPKWAILEDPAVQKLSVQLKGRKTSYLSCLLSRGRLRTVMCYGLPPSHPGLPACP